MIESLFKLAASAASIYDQKQKTKYADELLSIHKELQDEELKDTPDDGRISYLHQRVVCISDVLNNAIVPKNS